MRTICFAMFGVYSLVFGGFAGGILLGAISDAAGAARTHVASPSSGRSAPSGGSCCSSARATCAATSPSSSRTCWSATPRASAARPAGDIPALQVHNLDFYYGTNQVLFDVNLEVAQGEIVALLGTNGAGKSTLLRAVAGPRPSPPWGHPHLRGQLHLPRARADHRPGRGPAGRGQDDVPGLTVRDNLRIGGHSLRRARRPGPGRPRRGGRPVPRAGAPPRPAGRHPVGRRAADAGAGPGHDDRAPAADDRRARPRAGPHDGGPADGASCGRQRARAPR